MALTDMASRSAKPQAGRTIKLSDGGGLQLWVMPTGSKLWKIAYQFGGKQLKLSLGAYPVVGLKDARERREEVKRLLASGFDPGQQKEDRRVGEGQRGGQHIRRHRSELLDKKRREAKATGP